MIPILLWVLKVFCPLLCLYEEPYLSTAVFSLFCSHGVLQLFIPNLPPFRTTNRCLALFVFRTTNCLFLIQAQPPCCIVLSFSLSLPLYAPCYLWSPKLLGSREETWSYILHPQPSFPGGFSQALSETKNLLSPLPHYFSSQYAKCIPPARLTFLFEPKVINICIRWLIDGRDFHPLRNHPIPDTMQKKKKMQFFFFATAKIDVVILQWWALQG